VIDSPLLLLGLLAVIVAAPLLLKRHRAAAPDGIRVLGRTALHKNAVVAVIAVGDRRLLVGAGERGVQVLADLAGTAGTADATSTMTSLGRTDTPELVPFGSDDDALAALVADGPGTTTAGPGIGLLDRLRAMTVRTPERGRPSHDPLRR
jgi:flagellar biogenesis protein FliO